MLQGQWFQEIPGNPSRPFGGSTGGQLVSRRILTEVSSQYKIPLLQSLRLQTHLPVTSERLFHCISNLELHPISTVSHSRENMSPAFKSVTKGLR